jgi:hypothetical protein
VAGLQRWLAGVAVERHQMLAELCEIEESVNASQAVIARDVVSLTQAGVFFFWTGLAC